MPSGSPGGNIDSIAIGSSSQLSRSDCIQVSVADELSGDRTVPPFASPPPVTPERRPDPVLQGLVAHSFLRVELGRVIVEHVIAGQMKLAASLFPVPHAPGSR